MTARLATSEASAPIIAILDYPLEEALSPYRAVIVPMLLVLGGALIVALTVAMLIAHGVSQPWKRSRRPRGASPKATTAPSPPSAGATRSASCPRRSAT